MEQRPIPGHDPLAPPTADVARAYLDEIGTVVQRRESLIDRRRMARLAGAEAIVLAVYLTVMMFSFGKSVGSPFMMIVALLLVWIQFSAELRENYGGQPRLSGTSQRVYLAFGLGAVLAAMVVIWLQIVGVEIPVLARFVPGIALLAVFGGRALHTLHRAPQALPDDRDPFSTGARYATAGLGIVVGLGVWATASGESMLAAILSPFVMVLLLGWSIAAYASSKLPALGAIWRWPQWSAFALGGAILVAVMLLAMHTDVITVPLGIVLAVSIAVLFAVVAFAGGRDVR